MTTQEIIDEALPWCPGWERSSGRKNLLKVLQHGLDEAFRYDHDSMIYRGADNEGFPPYLYTTAGTYQYSVSAAYLSCGAITRSIGGTNYTLTARKVKKIFVDTTALSPAYFDAWTGTPYRTILNPYYQNNQVRIFVADVTVSSQPAYGNTAPTVMFQNDPGTHQDKFFIEFYVGPPRLLSESIQAPIPVGFESDFVNYIIGRVQLMESGRMNDRLNYFREITVENFRAEYGTAASTENKYTPIRLC